MKLKYAFEFVEIDGDVMAVPVGENAPELKGLFRLNESTSAIVKLLKEDTTEEAIADELQKTYSGSREEIMGFVHTTVEKLRAANVLE